MGYNDSRLTQAEAEAQAVAAVVGGKCLTGTAANRAAVLAESANYRYLHLSCHGAFNPIWPMLSHLRLADQALDVADIVENLRLNAELVSLSACATGRSQILRGDE